MSRFTATLVLLTLLARTSWAQELPCTASDDDPPAFPCGFQVEALALQKAPSLLHLQAKIAQAKLPGGTTTFATVIVKLLRGTEVLCLEQLSQVQVNKSVMNLTIGENMSCDLGAAIAENQSLAFQVCLGGVDNCLKPIELSTLPYAIKASYASLAQQAGRANTAGQASYAQRATADRDMMLRKKVGVGYFDFFTPEATAAADVYAGAAFQDFEDGGFLQWSPVRDATARRLHIAGKRDATDRLERLDELVLGSASTVMHGDLTVSPTPSGAGLTVQGGGMAIVGDSQVQGSLLVVGAANDQDVLSVGGDATYQAGLLVAGAVTVQSGGLHAVGDSDLGGALLVSGGLTVQGGLQVAGSGTIDGVLVVTDAKATGGLTVPGVATLAALEVSIAKATGALSAGSAAVSGSAKLGGALGVNGGLTAQGEATFHELVTFADADLGIDSRYLLAKDETRTLTVDGKVAVGKAVSVGGDLDLAYHPLLNARLQSAATAPVPCNAQNEGFVYLDTTTAKLTFCVSGAYQTVAGDECGNGWVEPSEVCDDGNTTAGDGCSALCTLEGAPWTCTSKSVQPTKCTKP